MRSGVSQPIATEVIGNQMPLASIGTHIYSHTFKHMCAHTHAHTHKKHNHSFPGKPEIATVLEGILEGVGVNLQSQHQELNISESTSRQSIFKMASLSETAFLGKLL